MKTIGGKSLDVYSSPMVSNLEPLVPFREGFTDPTDTRISLNDDINEVRNIAIPAENKWNMNIDNYNILDQDTAELRNVAALTMAKDVAEDYDSTVFNNYHELLKKSNLLASDDPASAAMNAWENKNRKAVNNKSTLIQYQDDTRNLIQGSNNVFILSSIFLSTLMIFGFISYL